MAIILYSRLSQWTFIFWILAIINKFPKIKESRGNYPLGFWTT